MVQLERIGAILVVMLLLAPAVLADSIELINPADRIKINSSYDKIDYIFNLSNTHRVEVCTLILKGIPVKNITYIRQNNQNLISYNTSDAYNYYWQVKCYDEQDNIISSDIHFFLKGEAPKTFQVEPASSSPEGSGSPVYYPPSTEVPKNQDYGVWSKIPLVGKIPPIQLFLGLVFLVVMKMYFLKK